jgi:hypothetical protein
MEKPDVTRVRKEVKRRAIYHELRGSNKTDYDRPTMRCDRVGERKKINDIGPIRCLELLPYWRACVMTIF